LTLVIKKLNERTLRELKAEAARRGLTLAQVFEEAVNTWLNQNREAYAITETDRNNDFYESNIAELEAQHRGKYILVAHGRLVGVYENLDQAGEAINAITPKTAQAILTKVGEDVKEFGEWLGGSLER